MQVQLTRDGRAPGRCAIKITKGVTLEAGSDALEIAYLLEGLPADRALHFGVEFNFAGLPSGADDRYFHRGERIANSANSARSSICTTRRSLAWSTSGSASTSACRRIVPTNIWTFPIETVSQSEGGFELVHQSVVVLPHWIVRGDAEGRWSVTMQLDIDTAMALARSQTAGAMATV